MNQTVKMQHYVPRFYLSYFAIDPTKDVPQVYCYGKPDRSQFQTAITNIAGETYFYEPPGDQPFENTLASIEGEFSDAYDKLIDARSLEVLDVNDRSAIAYSIAIQELRTRESREEFHEMFSKLRERLEDESMTPEMEDQMDELREMDSEDGARDFQIDFIKSHGWEMAEHYLDLKWIVIENESRQPFWTSDHPIVRHNSNDFSPYGNLGLKNRGIQVYLPLSPELSLGFVDPESFWDVPTNLTLDSTDEGLEHVTFQNSLQVREATRHLISNQSNFTLADDYLDEYPEYANTDRDRVDMT
jgi:hypothetical protein